MSDSPSLTGPDFSGGVPSSSLRDAEPLLGHAQGEPVILVRSGGKVYATGATCTHYGGPLAEGLVDGATVRCPWHHACFDLSNGESRGGPALSPIPCFDVREEQGVVTVGNKRTPARPATAKGPSSVLVVGAGPAGTACAETLRRRGYDGPVTMVGAEAPGPVDRPNLSKDYLAGTAPEEWIALRTAEALREQQIELVAEDAVLRLALREHEATLASGRVERFGALVLATGAEPAVLGVEGATLPHVHTLRTLADARSIIAAASHAKRAVVVGASFIGLEAAASLRKRGLSVTVVGPGAIPLARILGDEVGRFVRRVHEENGVAFRLGVKPERITASEVVLSDGSALAAELVVVGVGVRPRTKLAEEAGLHVDDGVIVDDRFRASSPDVYAIGDVARFPYDGEWVRIEHFAVAERHGQAAARAILGQSEEGDPRKPEARRDVPFFWSQHHDVTLSYVGHAATFEVASVHGDLQKRDAIVAYRRGGRVRAVLTVGRDKASLAAELALLRGDDGALAALLHA